MSNVSKALSVLFVLYFTASASAADLTGSYEGSISCTTLTNVEEIYRTTIPAWAHISYEQFHEYNGETWYQMHYVYGFQAVGPGYKASQLVSAFDTTQGNSNNNLETGKVSTVQCGTEIGGMVQYSIRTNSYEFGIGDYTILPTGKTTIDFTYYRNSPYPSDCKLSLTRTTTDDPYVTREGPIPGISNPQAYTCPDRP